MSERNASTHFDDGGIWEEDPVADRRIGQASSEEYQPGGVAGPSFEQRSVGRELSKVNTVLNKSPGVHGHRVHAAADCLALVDVDRRASGNAMEPRVLDGQ